LIREGVHDSAWNEQLFSPAELRLLAIDGPRHNAVHADDALVILAMQVRDDRVGMRRDGYLEEIQRTIGLVATFEEGDDHFTNANEFMHGFSILSQ
jgi:hypothetical protein